MAQCTNSTGDISTVDGTLLQANLVLGNSNPLFSSLLWPRQQYSSTKCWTLWQQELTDTILVDQSNLFTLKTTWQMAHYSTVNPPYCDKPINKHPL